MKKLEKGKFFGSSGKQFSIGGLTVVDSCFTNFQSCPWHYHENAHFAFTTGGTLVETHKKEKINLSKGFLMFNNSQDPHFNSDYSEHVSALHIDIDKSWFAKHLISPGDLEGVFKLHDPAIKNIFAGIYGEIKRFDKFSPLAIEGLVLQALAAMMREGQAKKSGVPAWFGKAREILRDRSAEKFSLQQLASELGVHPVHLSRQFPVYSRETIGNYLRKIRVEKATSMLADRSLSLAQVAYACGFADQSHFTRIFKKVHGITPAAFREMIK